MRPRYSPMTPRQNICMLPKASTIIAMLVQPGTAAPVNHCQSAYKPNSNAISTDHKLKYRLRRSGAAEELVIASAAHLVIPRHGYFVVPEKRGARRNGTGT